jgi:hypothetical protein
MNEVEEMTRVLDRVALLAAAAPARRTRTQGTRWSRAPRGRVVEVRVS